MKQDELRGKKHTVKYRDDNLYVSIFPTEVFISSIADNQDKHTASGLNAITRLVSLCMQNGLREQAIDQLTKASSFNGDIPGILSRLMVDE